MRYLRKPASLILCIILFIVGCKKDQQDSDCFKLKSVYLYQGSNTSCSSNIWQVEESPDKDIPASSYVTITINDSYDPTTVKIGDIVYLKLTMKVQKAPGIDPQCSYSWGYLLQGDFCK